MNVHTAATRGDLQWLIAFVEQDAAVVHAVDTKGATPLLYAAERGHVGVARYLLDHGVTINHRDHRRESALHLAACYGSPAVMPLLLERGADVIAADDWGRTPLMCAAMYGWDAVICVLLEHGGTDVDAADHDGRTACHWACVEGHSGVLRQLLQAGADPFLRDAQGRTAVDSAATGKEHYQHCTRILQGWQRAYTLYRVRSIRDVSLIVANSSAAVDAAPAYLVDRARSGLTMPTVHVSPHQQHEQPSGVVGEEGHIEVDPLAVEGVVTLYVIEELNGVVFVEELFGTTGWMWRSQAVSDFK